MDDDQTSNFPFLETNREERFFCAILVHALLTPSSSQHRLLDVVGRACGADLQAQSLEVYVEVAALRDAWYALGNHKQYTPQVHQARLQTLHELLRVTSHFTGTAQALDALVQE